jgi:hypothetical protein
VAKAVAGLEWHGDDFKKWIAGEMRLRLAAASEVVKSRAVRLLSVSVWELSKVDYVRVHRRIKGRNTTTIQVKKSYDLVRSKPGEPPRAETSTLRKSVHYEVLYTELRARVGTNVKYGLYLQLGVRSKRRGAKGRWRIAPRPWLDVALRIEQARVTRILTRPLPKTRRNAG